MMADERPTDLDEARQIVSRHGTFVGNSGEMREYIAKAVADSIALGRKLGRDEGIGLAAEAIARLKGQGNA
jgi:hypothetical protein